MGRGCRGMSEVTQTEALHNNGVIGKVWTNGYDKRFCFDTDSLTMRIEYVKRHSGIVWVNT